MSLIRTGIVVACSNCKDNVYIPKWRIKRGCSKHFCNNKCYAVFKTTVRTSGEPSQMRICTICSIQFMAQSAVIKRGKAKACGRECAKISISNTLTGRKNPEHSLRMKGSQNAYKVDRSTLSKRFSRKNWTYYNWRQAVCNRDEWKCKIGGGTCCDLLEAHHILNFIDYPELRYDINNGIALCRNHHPRGRKREVAMQEQLQELILK